MKKHIIHFLFLLLFSPVLAINPSESKFSGGYLSLGLQIGKTKNKTLYFDIQISPSIVLIGPYKHNFQGYLFFGSSIGKRYGGGNSFKYIDVNLNFWNVLFTLGTGKGFVFDEGKKYQRTKYWGGLGFVPIILCTDNYYINNNKYKQIGIMGILPLPVFGYNFYP